MLFRSLRFRLCGPRGGAGNAFAGGWSSLYVRLRAGYVTCYDRAEYTHKPPHTPHEALFRSQFARGHCARSRLAHCAGRWVSRQPVYQPYRGDPCLSWWRHFADGERAVTVNSLQSQNDHATNETYQLLNCFDNWHVSISPIDGPGYFPPFFDLGFRSGGAIAVPVCSYFGTLCTPATLAALVTTFLPLLFFFSSFDILAGFDRDNTPPHKTLYLLRPASGFLPVWREINYPAAVGKPPTELLRRHDPHAARVQCLAAPIQTPVTG